MWCTSRIYFRSSTFLLYINDIVNISNLLAYILFADDTNIFISGNNIDDIDDIQHIKMKIAKNLGILCKAKKMFEVSTLTTLYYSFIYPYVTYCIEVYDTAANI